MIAAIRYRFVSMLVLAMTLPLAMAMMAFAESGSHGDGHAEMHEHYNMWIDNRGFGCCDNRDCRPSCRCHASSLLKKVFRVGPRATLVRLSVS